jgi:archaetidylinositol phosphate synthase
MKSNEESSGSGKRVNDILLGPLERPALEFFCKHMPRWVTPDHLTLLGVLAGFLIGVRYYLTTVDRNFLWLASFGVVVHWFGDSLDGNLARYRKIERPKYGYYVDHIVDAYVTTIICIGIGLSAYVGFVFAMFDLVAYLLMSVMTYISSNVTGVFKISYGKFGPTEVRVVIILANVYFYFGPNPTFDFTYFQITFYNLMAAVTAFLIFMYFLVFSLKQIRELAILEPAKKSVQN